MNRRSTVKLVTLILLMALLSMPRLGVFSSGQNASFQAISAGETLEMTIFTDDKGGSSSSGVVENLVIAFYNITAPPFNTSQAAFYDGFQYAKLSVVFGSLFPLFLRVSYDNSTSPNQADASADCVLGEFQKAFNIPLNVENKTHVVSSVNSTVDVYFKLGDLQQKFESFVELIRYVPSEGFGSLINRDLLSLYVPNDSSNSVYLLEYKLTKVDQSYIMEFRLELGHQFDYSGENCINVNLNELLNHSGPLMPSTQRNSQTRVYIYKKQFTSSRSPLNLILNSSSPPYSSLEDQDGVLTIAYDLAGPVDNILLTITIAPEAGFNWTYVAFTVAAISVACIAVFAFVKLRRTRREDTGNVKTATQQNPNATIT